jgi:arsenate reductase
MRQTRLYNVLFLCTGNSARSLIAEAVLNRVGVGKFAAFSAGSHPKREPHPEALALLKRLNHPTDELRCKSWDELARDGAPKLDFVFTLCDAAAEEVCPVWPGQPVTAHWGMPDPSAVKGSPAEAAAAFAEAYRMITARITAFAELPIESLDRLALAERVAAIGKSSARGATSEPAR